MSLRRVRTALPIVLFVEAVSVGVAPGRAAQAVLDHTFRIQCEYSHAAMDDPIVFPKQPGASHLHTFFGNTSTNAFSTYTTLRASTTTCNETDDASGYWVPALYQKGTFVAPQHIAAYYRAANKDPATIHAFPAGLRVVAGDAHAMAAQAAWITTWTCAGVGVPTDEGVPWCIGTLQMIIFFPDCWDGVHLDSADHKSHMAYAEPPGEVPNRSCPPTHPVPVPQIRLEAAYVSPTLGVIGGPGTTLSSGAPYTAHGDFFNAWNQPTLEANVRCNVNGLGLACVV